MFLIVFGFSNSTHLGKNIIFDLFVHFQTSMLLTIAIFLFLQPSGSKRQFEQIFYDFILRIFTTSNKQYFFMTTHRECYA